MHGIKIKFHNNLHTSYQCKINKPLKWRTNEMLNWTVQDINLFPHKTA